MGMTNNKMTHEILRNLISGQRYLFTAKITNQNDEYTFRADFVDVLGLIPGVTDTLHVKNVRCETRGEINDCGLLSMPALWITKVETLENITNGKLILPSEIMLIIDSFY